MVKGILPFMRTILTIFVAIVLCGCALFDPAQDGSHVGVVTGGTTNDIPAVAIATAATWICSALFGVSIPPSVSIPVGGALISLWFLIRKRRRDKAFSEGA
jgi:hypothetical protein